MANKDFSVITAKDHSEQTMPLFASNGIILFFHPYNLPSQKIQLILYEKKLNFTSYPMDIANGEQFSTWFLKLNPKGDVPVLKDNGDVICGSGAIIEYLETKYNGGDYVCLKHLRPMENSKAEKLIEQLNSLPTGALSLGSFIHEDLKLTPKPPFVGPARQSCLKNNEHIYELLKTSLELPEQSNGLTEIVRQNLQKKLLLFQRRRHLVYSRRGYQSLLNAVGDVLLAIDEQLCQHPNQEWLFRGEFTLADIHLGILLIRLHQLGFENYYWAYGKLPNVESYFLRFCQRSSVQRLTPSGLMLLKNLWQLTPSIYKLGTGAGVLAIGMLAAFVHK